MGRLSFLVLVISFILKPIAYSEEVAHVEDLWTATGISLSYVQKQILNPRNCTVDQTAYYACVRAMNILLQDIDSVKTTTLETDESLASLKHLASSMETKINPVLERDFGFFKIVTTEKIVQKEGLPLGSMENSILFQRKAIKSQIKYWYSLKAKAKLHPLPIESVLGWVKQNRLTKKNEALKSALAFNTYINMGVDAHGHLDTLAELTEEQSNVANDYVGVGLIIKLEGQFTTVNAVSKGAGAFEAGIQVGDIIESINGEEIRNLSNSQVAKKLRGLENSTVAVKILRGEKKIAFTLTRKKVHQPNVNQEMLTSVDRVTQQARSIGYIRIRDFLTGDTCDQLSQAIISVQKKGAQALILDLRDNGGGDVALIKCSAGYFIGNKNPFLRLVSLEGAFSRIEDILYTNRTKIVDVPSVVLVNNYSASASEILAGVLQDYGASDVVGIRTFGKGSVQTDETQFGTGLEGTIFFKTVAQYYLPGNQIRRSHSPQVVGIVPDLEIYSGPQPTEFEKTGLFREPDVSPLILEPNSAQLTVPQPHRTRFLTQCVGQHGTAQEKYQKAISEKSGLPDYQLLAAADAAACKIEQRIPTRQLSAEAELKH